MWTKLHVSQWFRHTQCAETVATCSLLHVSPQRAHAATSAYSSRGSAEALSKALEQEKAARLEHIGQLGLKRMMNRELALGFHWPPWYSVPWLHLHAIYPRRKMIKRWKYTPLTFKSPEWVLRHIGAEK